MDMKKIRATLSTIKNYPAYPGLVLPDSVSCLKMLNNLSIFMNKKDYKYRKELLNKLQESNNKTSIEDKDGFLIKDMSQNQVVMDGIENAKRVVASVDWKERAKNSKKSFLINHKIDLNDPENEALLKLATSPEILKPISEYLGIFPVLSTAAIWYSPNENPEPIGSQLYHLDGEDLKQVKCFVPIEEITEESGPLTLLPADISDDIYNKLHKKGAVKRRNTKLQDDVIYSYTDENKAVKVTGEPGTVAFVDTCRCYHYGSRAANKPRVLLHLHYYSAFSKMMPLWGQNERIISSDKSNSGEIQQALMGKAHLTFSNLRNEKMGK